jgi:hypothetical protein
VNRPPGEDPSPGWSQSLATGAPGIALLHLERIRAGAAGSGTAHQWIAASTRRPITAHPEASGLYYGVPAVAFTLHAAGHEAYAPALAQLDGHIDTLTRSRLDEAHRRIDRRQLPRLREFDLIRGLTGLGVYLLHRHGGGPLLHDVLGYLVRLSEPMTVAGEELPGWWCADGPSSASTGRWPGGHANLGLSHGIAGPLALLAVSALHGVTVAGQAEAIERICDCLDRWRSGSGRQAWWPGTISRSEWTAQALRQTGPAPPSWCYGTPGVARAQQLASLALADRDRQQRAEQALAGCVSDDAQLGQLRDASLCHGWAGVLLTTWRASIDARDDTLAGRVPYLRAQLDRHLHHHGTPTAHGLLDGIAGVHLAQLTTTAGPTHATGWDACLLLTSPCQSDNRLAVASRADRPTTPEGAR